MRRGLTGSRFFAGPAVALLAVLVLAGCAVNDYGATRSAGAGDDRSGNAFTDATAEGDTGQNENPVLAALTTLPAPKAEPPRADSVVVDKSNRQLYLKRDGAVLRSYDIALGFSPKGHKTKRGDGRTPEGRYTLDFRNPDSRFHRSIRVSYPNRQDVARARSQGLDPGDNIMIHGLPDDWAWLGRHHTRQDWTEGCIAVTNREMDEIWAMVDSGTPIHILP